MQNNSILDKYTKYLEKGVILNKVKIVGENGQHSIYAIDNISAGEVLISVDHEYAISAFKVFADEKCRNIIKAHPQFYPSLQQVANHKSDFQILILYLCLNRQGEMQPIFDMNPNPLCLLDCDQIPFQYLNEMRQEFQSEYDKHKEAIISIGVNSDDYDWAYRYCMNRRLSVDNDYPYSFLVPMVDMINHGKNKAIFGLEKQDCMDHDYFHNNYRKYQFIKSRKYWLQQEDQIILDTLIVNESQRSTKQLNKLINALYQELLLADSEDVWNVKIFDPDDSEEDETKPQSSQVNTQQVQAAVNDDYLRDYYEQQLEETDHDWYTENRQQQQQPEFTQQQQQQQQQKQEQEQEKEEQEEEEQQKEDSELFEKAQGQARLTARAIDDIEIGEEILNLYGCLGNEYLLMYYGFAMRKNKYDRVKFRVYMNCNKKSEFVEQLENQIFLHYVKYKDLLKKQSHDIDMNQLTTEFKLKKSKLNLDLVKFLKTYTNLLDGEPLKESEIIDCYRRLVKALIITFQVKIVGDGYWGQQLRNYGESKLRILQSHLEMCDCLGKEIRDIRVFRRVREYLQMQIH